jgi:hypothetical protein
MFFTDEEIELLEQEIYRSAENGEFFEDVKNNRKLES